MNRILLLTENINLETKVQNRLQKLNYEIFLSASLLEKFRDQRPLRQLGDLFPIIIISETIANHEAEILANYFSSSVTVVIRKTEEPPSQQLENKWQAAGFVGWISNDLSMEQLREKLFQYRRTGLVEKSDLLKVAPEAVLDNLHLSAMEKELLQLLLDRKDEVVSRRDISLKIWKEEPNPSTLSQISYKIGRIKHKIRQTYDIPSAIVTDWRKGYHLDPDFIQQIEASRMSIN